MGLSAAERARRYRENVHNDPARYQAYKNKENDRDRRAYVPIADITPREQRHQRRHWKKGSQKFRDRQIQLPLPLSPPPSPASSPRNVPMPSPDIPEADGQRQRGWKKVKATRAISYRMIANLNRQLEAKNALMEKWKRRYYRQVNGDNPTTPPSKAKKMLRKCRVTLYVRKQLILHNAVIEQIRKKYQETRECKVKSLLRRTVANVHKKNTV